MKNFGQLSLRATGGLKFLKEECHDDQTHVREHTEVDGQSDETISITKL